MPVLTVYVANIVALSRRSYGAASYLKVEGEVERLGFAWHEEQVGGPTILNVELVLAQQQFGTTAQSKPRLATLFGDHTCASYAAYPAIL